MFWNQGLADEYVGYLRGRVKALRGDVREERRLRWTKMQRKCDMEWKKAEETTKTQFLFFPNKVR